MAELRERIPPQSIEAEQSVLGAILQNNEALHVAMEMLKEEYFYLPKHRRIFSSIRKLYESSSAVDLITVSAELSNQGLLDEIGGRRYLMDLTDSVVTFSNVEDHSRLVIEAAVKNQLINNCSEIINRSYDTSVEADNLLDYAESKIFTIKEESLKGEIYHLKPILETALHQIEEYSNRAGFITGVPSGYMNLDEMTSGFQPSELIIIAARPSMGKTAFALNIADYVAVEKSTPVCIFSLEMSKEQLAQRLLCSRARISSHHMKTGRLADHQWTNLSIAAGPLSEAPIYLDDSASLSVLEIRAKARRMKHRYDIGLLIIDYMQLVKGQKNAESRQQEISYISQSLKSLARELKIPVIALSQLSRQVEMRGPSARPKLSDLRESGAIEQDADMVIFIHRPPTKPNEEEEYTPDNLPGSVAEIIIGKQRNGPTGMVSLVFIKDFARFELMDVHHGSPY
jgi:replicative DNA helicase